MEASVGGSRGEANHPVTRLHVGPCPNAVLTGRLCRPSLVGVTIWFRVRPRWVTTLLVLALAAVQMPHLAAAHHDEHGTVIVSHDASAHRVGGSGVGQSDRQEHCLACHWGRSLRLGLESSVPKAPAIEPADVRVSDQPSVSGRAPVAQPSLRSPPFLPIAI